MEYEAWQRRMAYAFAGIGRFVLLEGFEHWNVMAKYFGVSPRTADPPLRELFEKWSQSAATGPEL